MNQQHNQQQQQQQQLIQQLQQENQQQQQLIQELLQQGGNDDHNHDAPQVIVPQQEEQPDDQQQQHEDEDPSPVMSVEMKSAIRRGDVLKIISLVDAGESPNCVDEDGDTAVMRALYFGKLASVKVLFGWGADLSKLGWHGRNVLHAAAAGGHLDCIDWVFANTTIGVNSTDDEGRTPVMYSLQHGQLKASKALFARGTDLAIVDTDGSNVLHYTAAGGHLDCIKWVYANTKIDVNAPRMNGMTPIMDAFFFNKLDAAKLLVEKGANLFLKDRNNIFAIDIRVVNDEPDGEQLGPQVLQHAKEVRWSAAKEFVLLSTSCQSADRRQLANHPTSIYDGENIFRSARLAVSVFGERGLSRLIASYIMRTDILVRDKSIPLVKEPDAVKKRVEAALASGSSSSKERARSD
jgi:ankyrin repeat protein